MICDLRGSLGSQEIEKCFISEAKKVCHFAISRPTGAPGDRTNPYVFLAQIASPRFPGRRDSVPREREPPGDLRSLSGGVRFPLYIHTFIIACGPKAAPSRVFNFRCAQSYEYKPRSEFAVQENHRIDKHLGFVHGFTLLHILFALKFF